MTSHVDPPRTSDRRRQLLESLEAGVLELRSSQSWRHYLALQARFHRYSPRNVQLIALQRPDATHVAGFATWKSLDRHVKKGETAISILAPLLGRDDTPTSPRVIGFRWVNVFDVSQTDGRPLVSPVSILEGSDESRLEVRLCAAARSLGLAVRSGSLPSGVNGELRWSTNTIVVQGRNPPLQRAKTVAHELAHALLHRHEPDRTRAEVEAESVAYVVLAALGADSSPYTFGYVASWLGDDTDVGATLTRSCDAIHRASRTILDLVEDHSDPSSDRTPSPVPAQG